MKLFENPFGKKQKKASQNITPKQSQYRQEWEFYFSNVDDIVGSFFINIGLREAAPVSEKPNMIWVSIKMNHPRQDGLSSNEEFETLKKIEDRTVEAITKVHTAIYTGRLTTNGRRIFYFYLSDTSMLDKTITKSILQFPEYTYDYGIIEDAAWSYYFNFLFPLPSQMESIQNRRVIEQLERRGDSLTKARQVDHWIFFNTRDERQHFIERIRNDNFAIVDAGEITLGNKKQYRLQISRIDKVDHASVDEYVLYLWRLAKEYNGEYDGWETSVEKD